MNSKSQYSHSNDLVERFNATRNDTLNICENLETEDFVIQSESFISPPKWHLGHTTWFFQEILKRYDEKIVEKYSSSGAIYNSYYKKLGDHWDQSKRGILSRPTVDEVLSYRKFIDDLIIETLQKDNFNKDCLKLIELGIHHEQQHQELLLMDIKHILFQNIDYPALYETKNNKIENETSWTHIDEGLYQIGHEINKQKFSYDNESPMHNVYLYQSKISNGFVTNGQFLEFINDNQYLKPDCWLSLGWDWVEKHKVSSPLYWNWIKKDEEWYEYTLRGLHKLDLTRPVSHISYFEASAFAKWSGYRLPTENEYEYSLSQNSSHLKENYLEAINIEGQALWGWTSSSYEPYPGYKEFEGFVKEYNGKFMCQQYVLRGGSFATLKSHFRNTYRNFYHPEQRWMFSGIKLAKDLN